MTYLLDVNVLVSLAWPNHLHHGAAHAWFAARGTRSWATTPVAESGFVRVSSNRSAIPTAVSPPEALSLLGRIRSVPGHVFLADDVELVVGSDLDPLRLVTHTAVTDAHLLAVARRHHATLVTFDRGVAALAGRESNDVLVLTR